MVENVETQALSVSTNFDNLSDAELMRLTGQTDGGGPSGSVLSRLSINYDTEDENENPLPRGNFALKLDGENIYLTLVYPL